MFRIEFNFYGMIPSVVAKRWLLIFATCEKFNYYQSTGFSTNTKCSFAHFVERTFPKINKDDWLKLIHFEIV